MDIITRLRVLFIDTTHPQLLHLLRESGFECDYKTDLTREEILKIIPEYHGVILRSKIKFDSDIIDLAEKLEFIGRVGAGLENIDVNYAKSKGIRCFNSPEGNRDAVGEHTLGLVLGLLNHIPLANYQVKSGQWIREQNRGVEIKGKTVGILGYGNMGSAFAQRLAGFNCSVIAYDKYKTSYSSDFVTESTLKDFFAKTDILSLHIPLTDETRYMVDDAFINKFKKPIYLINTARGPVVRTADLVKNLDKGKILGAALDVLEYEATSFENLAQTNLPPAFEALLKNDRVIITPHVAGWSTESNLKLSEILANKIIAAFGQQNQTEL